MGMLEPKCKTQFGECTPKKHCNPQKPAKRPSTTLKTPQQASAQRKHQTTQTYRADRLTNRLLYNPLHSSTTLYSPE